ncbi:hypothetical protein QJQ45_028703 [Haematococcus lacustris]|nr:hypothetical protein QJQ45_028703 [Haematococcus lacustris]
MQLPCQLSELLQLVQERQHGCTEPSGSGQLAKGFQDKASEPEFQLVWPPCAVLGEAVAVEVRLISTLASPSPCPSAGGSPVRSMPLVTDPSQGTTLGGHAEMWDTPAPLVAAPGALVANNAGKSRPASLLSVVGTSVQSAVPLTVPTRGSVAARWVGSRNVVSSVFELGDSAVFAVWVQGAGVLAWSMMCEALPEGTELPAFHPSVFDAPFGSLLPRLQAILACYPAIMVLLLSSIHSVALVIYSEQAECWLLSGTGDEHEVEYRCVLSALVGFVREHDCWASLSCLLGGLRQRGLELLLGPEPPYSDSSSGIPMDAPATADAYSSLHLPGCPSHQALTALDLQSDTAPGLANGLRGLCNCPLVQPSSCWRTDSLASCNSLMLDSTEVQQPMAEAADRLPAGSQAMHPQNSSSAGNNADSSGCGSSWSTSSGLSALPVLQALSGTQHQPSRCLPMAPAADNFRRKATAVQFRGMLPGAPTSHRALQGAAAAAVKYGLTLVLWLALWVLVTDMLAVCRTLLPQLFDYLAVHPSKSCQELSPAGHVPGGGAEAWLVFATGVSAAGLAVAITVGCMRGSSTQGRQQGSSRSEGGLRWPGVIAWCKADAAAAMQA